MEFTVRSIGVAHTPYQDMDDAPFQGRFSESEAIVDIYEEYASALKDVDAATHLIVLYWADAARRDVLQTVTPWGPEQRGVFACRSPSRPNPILFCVVELVRREGDRLVVRGLDATDGSHILDIKPYSAQIDVVPEASLAWFDAEQRRPGSNKRGAWPGDRPSRPDVEESAGNDQDT